MARRNLDNIKEAMILDWENGKYKNLNKLGKAYGVTNVTATNIITRSGAVKGANVDKIQHKVKVMKDHLLNPTEETLKAIEDDLKTDNPVYNLLDFDNIREVAKDRLTTEIMTMISEKLVQSNILATQFGVSRFLAKGTKEVLVGSLKTEMGVSIENMELELNDYKTITEISDKSLISLGLADRHAPKGDVNVQQNNVEGGIKYLANIPAIDEDQNYDKGAIDVEPLKEAV